MTEREKDLVQKRLDDGWSTSEIAEAMGVHPSTVRYNARNLSGRKKDGGGTKKAVTAAVEAFQGQRTLKGVAEMLNVTPTKAKKLLEEAGYPQRAGRASWRQGKEYRVKTVDGTIYEGTAAGVAGAMRMTVNSFRQAVHRWKVAGRNADWTECEVRDVR